MLNRGILVPTNACFEGKQRGVQTMTFVKLTFYLAVGVDTL